MLTLESASSESIDRDAAAQLRSSIRLLLHAQTNSARHQSASSDVIATATKDVFRHLSEDLKKGALSRSAVFAMLLGLRRPLDEATQPRKPQDHVVAMALQVLNAQSPAALPVLTALTDAKHGESLMQAKLLLLWVERARSAATAQRLSALDKVRLIAPGTAFEKAALRQALNLSLTGNDPLAALRYLMHLAMRFPAADRRVSHMRADIAAIARASTTAHEAQLIVALEDRRFQTSIGFGILLDLTEEFLMRGRIALAEATLQRFQRNARNDASLLARGRYYEAAVRQMQLQTPTPTTPHVPEATSSIRIDETLARQVTLISAFQAEQSRPAQMHQTARADIDAAKASASPERLVSEIPGLLVQAEATIREARDD